MSEYDPRRSINSSSDKGRRSLFIHADKMLRGVHQYPLLKHDDAVFLTNQLDDCVHACVSVVTLHSNWFKDAYVNVVETYAMNPADRNSYSAHSDDAVLMHTLFCLDETDWLTIVRERVSLFRLHWIKSIHELSSIIKTYVDDTLVSSDDVDYIHARERCSQVEQILGVSSEVMFGLANEITYYQKRIDKITNKMTCPYLRRIAVLAKKYTSGNPDIFLDNFQSGVEGIHIAIGRYHVNMGSFAGIVDTWAINKIIAWVRKASNFVKVPDRVWAHKKLYEKQSSKTPLASSEDIAEAIGVPESTMLSSLKLADMQGTAQILDESETDDFGRGNESYVDTTFMDSDTVNTFMLEYGHVLTPEDRVILTLVFGCDTDGMSFGNAEEIERETLRQLLASHSRELAVSTQKRKRN